MNCVPWFLLPGVVLPPMRYFYLDFVIQVDERIPLDFYLFFLVWVLSSPSGHG